MSPLDESFMQLALSLAETAAYLDEVPVGAVMVKDGLVVGTGYNRRERSRQATAHAEIDAIQMASRTLETWRLSGCTLYVTLEPCLMCAGAIYQARVSRVVFGAHDPKAGAMGSLYSVHEDQRLNHRLPVESGVLSGEAAQMLKAFFRNKRY